MKEIIDWQQLKSILSYKDFVSLEEKIGKRFRLSLRQRINTSAYHDRPDIDKDIADNEKEINELLLKYAIKSTREVNNEI